MPEAIFLLIFACSSDYCLEIAQDVERADNVLEVKDRENERQKKIDK
jgi:hypothetical protein